MQGGTLIDEIQKGISDVNAFVRERFDPMDERMGILGEEMERLKTEIKEVLDLQRESARNQLLISRENIPRQMYKAVGGTFDFLDETDLKIVNAFYSANKRLENSGHLTREQVANLPRWKDQIDSVKRALDSTTSGSGDELVPTAELGELWMDINLATAVKSLFRNINMPTNPFDVPLQLGDVTWYRGTANVNATGTDLITSKRTLTAHEFVAMVSWAYEIDEDAVIAMLPEIRATLVRNAAEVMDDIIVNGDTTDDGTNINGDGADSGGLSGTAEYDHFLALDGLIHIALIDNTNQNNDHNAAVSDDMFNEIRAKMDKYGVRPSELAWITDLNTYIRAQSVDNFQTLDKMGPRATQLTGQLGAVEGIPVIVSEQMLLADTDGKVTYAGNGSDTGRLLCVNRNQYWTGSKRELLVEVEKDIQKRQTIMVVSFRMAFDGRNTNSSDNAVALQYDITGVG